MAPVAAQTICAFAVSGISGSGKSAERKAPSCSYGTYGISGSFSFNGVHGAGCAGKKMVSRRKKGPGDLSSSGSLYLQFFRLFCLQCGKLSDGSYLAGKSCFGFRTFAVSALFVYIVFPRKKAGDILGSTGACQYKLLPSVLYGSDTCTSFDRLLFYHFPDCQERLETGIGRIFMLPAFHCPGDRVYFNGLTGGWK